jgi:transposase
MNSMHTVRTDGRGHWPKGKRRSDVSRRARTEFVAQLRVAVARKNSSIRAVARLLDVSDRTVRRWLAGEDWPASAEQMVAYARRLGKQSVTQ